MKPEVFDEFYREHHGRLLRFIERRIDFQTAPDLCAHCFEVAWRKFDPREPFPLPWLYRTARNLLHNAYRKRANEFELLRQLRTHVGEHENERLLELREGIARLPALDQEALRLTYWEGLSAAEVGEVLNCSEQAAWKRLSRAKTRLRAGFEQSREVRTGTPDACS